MKRTQKREYRTQNTEYRKNLIVRFLASGLWLFCFVFFPLNLLTSLNGIASANSTAVSADPNDTHVRQLRLAEISAAKAQKESDSKKKLREIIEQIRAVEFSPQTQAQEPLAIPEQQPTIEPNEPSPDISTPNEDKLPAEEPKKPYEPVAEQTLEMIRNMSRKPDQVQNPLELAEILFLSGNLNDAAMLYQEALKRQDPNDDAVSRDRAWILFQTGNCLRNDDMPAAAKMYRRLVSEYPTSPWADLANARGKLIDWYLKDEPEKLVVEALSVNSRPE